MPQLIGGGLMYSFKDKLTVGVDVTWQNWAKYSLMGESDSLHNSITTNVGLQYIPDPSSGKFGKNIAIRVGAKYSTGYMQVNNTPISDFAVSFGLGLPFKTFSSKFALNLIFEYGSMGSTKNDLIRQDYFQVGLNLILVERWYQRVKLE